MTFDGDTYNLKSHLVNSVRIPKEYYGENKFMEDLEEEEEEVKEAEEDEDDDSVNDADEFNIQSVQSISLTTSMIATCHK
jgi:hypothetical protein